LFTPISGSQALVPEILGFDGADYIDPSTETDLILYGKRFSILETQVVAGGKYLTRNPLDPEKSKVDIIGRDVMRVMLPAGLQPTTVRDGKKYVEIVVSTPNGVSNHFPIPFGPPSSPQAVPEPLNVEPGYTLMDDLLKLAANVTPDNAQQSGGTQAGQTATTIQTTHTIQLTQGNQPAPSGQQGNPNAGGQGGQAHAPKVTAKPAKVAKGTRILSQTITADFRFPLPSSPDTVISVILEGIPYRAAEGSYVIDESVLDEGFVNDLITKLEDFGKLTGQNAHHDLTTKTILITIDGADAAPKSTTNQLRVNIELYVQKKPAPQQTRTAGAAAMFSATATDGTGRSVNATISGGQPGTATKPHDETKPSDDDSSSSPPGAGDGAASINNPRSTSQRTAGQYTNPPPFQTVLQPAQSRIPPPALLELPQRDLVVKRAARPAAVSSSSPAPLPSLPDLNPSTPHLDRAAPLRNLGDAAVKAPPRGSLANIGSTGNTGRAPSRSASLLSGGSTHDKSQAPAIDNAKPKRRSIFSRVLGQD
jgi:hypothetical protein